MFMRPIDFLDLSPAKSPRTRAASMPIPSSDTVSSVSPFPRRAEMVTSPGPIFFWMPCLTAFSTMGWRRSGGMRQSASSGMENSTRSFSPKRARSMRR